MPGAPELRSPRQSWHTHKGVLLTDARPLVALLDADEEDHERCRVLIDSLTLPMLTSWPPITEAVYLMGYAYGWMGREPLLRKFKAAASVAGKDTRHLRRLRQHLAERFVTEGVFYRGSKILAPDNRIHALPLAVLWGP